MLEVELWDYYFHTHFNFLHGFKKDFKFYYFQLSFRVNMFLEISFRNFKFGKTTFGKTSFIKEDLYQNVLTC